MESKIRRISDHLSLITLLPPIKGFDDFIGVWVYRNRFSFLIDVGPSSTAAKLLTALRELDVRHLDYIFLTHIHLDHAGAIGEVADQFPQAPVVCHQAGISHLVDPGRLWKGTQKVLGDTAIAYGPISAVDRKRLLSAEQFESDEVAPIITPGHAPHHVSYLMADTLFVGEAAGVFLALPRSNEYMRPATPPKFHLDSALESIAKLTARKPNRLCYGHFGMKEDGGKMLDLHRGQLLSWEQIIKQQLAGSKASSTPADLLKSLLREDPLLANFQRLPAAVQAREIGFLTNSIKGFLSYLDPMHPPRT